MWRMIAAAGLVYGLFNDNPFAGVGGVNGMLRRQNGITDEDEKAARMNQSDGKKAFRPLMIALPWRDSDGRVQFIDIGQWWGPARLMQGNPDDPMFNKFMANLVLGTVNGGLAEPAVNTVLNKVGLIDNPNRAPFEIRAETPLQKFLADAVQQGFVPGVVPNTLNTLRQGGYTGQQSQFEDTLTPTQTAMKLAGMPVLGGFTEDKSGVAAIKGDAGKMLESKTQIQRIITRPGAFADEAATAETQRMIEEEVKRIENAGEKMGERGKANDAARKPLNKDYLKL